MDPRFQNHVLYITVVECIKLKDTEWFTKQDPYVSFQYGSSKFRTRTCSSGGTAPVFQANFSLTLIQGLREIDVGVWNRHRLSRDNLIGHGRVQLQNVLAEGYDDRCWTILTKSGRFAGEVRLKMQYSQANAPPPFPNTAYPPPPPPPTGPSTTAYPPFDYTSAPATPAHRYADPGARSQRMYPPPPY